jgi:hypothetical protein
MGCLPSPRSPSSSIIIIIASLRVDAMTFLTMVSSLCSYPHIKILRFLLPACFLRSTSSCLSFLLRTHRISRWFSLFQHGTGQ